MSELQEKILKLLPDHTVNEIILTLKSDYNVINILENLAGIFYEPYVYSMRDTKKAEVMRLWNEGTPIDFLFTRFSYYNKSQIINLIVKKLGGKPKFKKIVSPNKSEVFELEELKKKVQYDDTEDVVAEMMKQIEKIKKPTGMRMDEAYSHYTIQAPSGKHAIVFLEKIIKDGIGEIEFFHFDNVGHICWLIAQINPEWKYVPLHHFRIIEFPSTDLKQELFSIMKYFDRIKDVNLYKYHKKISCIIQLNEQYITN